jgi:hypothetical protein
MYIIATFHDLITKEMYHNTKKIDRLKENMTKAKKMNKVTRDGL